MTRIVLIYASMTGNTEIMAEAVVKGIQEAGEEAEVIDVMNGVFAKDLLEYDGILLGSYTWGDGELPDEHGARASLDHQEAAGAGALCGVLPPRR